MTEAEQFIFCQKIIELVLSYKNHPDVWMEDNRRGEPPNPRFNQTKSGFFIEFYYSQLNRLWTPWGLKMIYGSGLGSNQSIAHEILERLGCFTEQPRLISRFTGTYGPVYGIQRIDDLILPPPVLREKADYLPFDAAREAWYAAGGSRAEDEEIDRLFESLRQ